jgi:hypothetical protein
VADIGPVTYTNTLGDGLNWSVTVAATDLVVRNKSRTQCLPASTCVSFRFESLRDDPNHVSVISPTSKGASATGMRSDCGQNLTFPSSSDLAPGTSYSGPLSLMSGATSVNQGSYIQGLCALSVSVPPGTANGNYNGSLQYTITG